MLALAFLAYEGALAVDGNGFVAAFVAGILFGATTRHRFHEATEFTETLSMFMSFLVWAVFGAGFVGPVLANGLQVAPLVYAVLSLTVVRMIPVALSLRRVGLQRDTVAFIGWFGPRGLASVVFTLLAFTTLREHGLGAGTILQVATYTILLSVIAHGLSATPLAAWYGAAGGARRRPTTPSTATPPSPASAARASPADGPDGRETTEAAGLVGLRLRDSSRGKDLNLRPLGYESASAGSSLDLEAATHPIARAEPAEQQREGAEAPRASMTTYLTLRMSPQLYQEALLASGLGERMNDQSPRPPLKAIPTTTSSG